MSIRWNKFKAAMAQRFGRDYLCKCGHKAKRYTVIEIDGEQGVYTLPKSRTYCPECWKSHAIKCAWCGNTILPGDGITLYTPNDKDFKVPSYAVVYSDEPLTLVGCMGWDCTDCGIDIAGYWQSPGQVRLIKPIIQRMVEDIEQGGDGVIVIPDLSKLE